MNSLTCRLCSGLVLSALFLLLLFLAPSLTVCALLCTVAVAGLLEFYALLGAQGIPSFRILGLMASVFIIAATWLSFTSGTAVLAGEHEQTLLFVSILAILVRQFPQKNNGQPLATVSCTLFGILYVPFLFNYFTKLAFTWETPDWISPLGGTGQRLLVYLVAVVKLNDIGAYLIGSRFGRHKLIPRISPGKTWEGFFGGTAFGLLASLAIHRLWGGRLGLLSFSAPDAVWLGLLLPIFGTVGDLSESLLKRTAGFKDTGRLVPGMGGVLDVLDSLLFAAPILYLYCRMLLSTP